MLESVLVRHLEVQQGLRGLNQETTLREPLHHEHWQDRVKPRKTVAKSQGLHLALQGFQVKLLVLQVKLESQELQVKLH